MKNKIYLCFQGIGKSTLASTNHDFVDLESSSFKYEDGTRPKNWVELYCQTALHLLASGHSVFMATHPETRAWFNSHNIPYTVIFPDLKLKDEWLVKLKERFDNDPSPKNQVAYEQALMNYDKFISCLMEEENKIIINGMGYNLQDVIDIEEVFQK